VSHSQILSGYYSIPEYHGPVGSTNHGLGFSPPIPLRTGWGAQWLSELLPWEQTRLLHSQADWLNAPIRQVFVSTGSHYMVVFTVAEANSDAAVQARELVSPSIEEQIATIRSTLSLQVSELAKVLAVERPTVYAWMNGRNVPHKSNRERLHKMFRLATHWNRMMPKPVGKALHEIDSDGMSLFSLLCQQPMPSGALRERLRSMARSFKMEAPAGGPKSVRALALRHKINLADVENRQDILDPETGKRSSPD
jgi:DNA-binding transcriptional regulator YiaG